MTQINALTYAIICQKGFDNMIYIGILQLWFIDIRKHTDTETDPKEGELFAVYGALGFISTEACKGTPQRI